MWPSWLSIRYVVTGIYNIVSCIGVGTRGPGCHDPHRFYNFSTGIRFSTYKLTLKSLYAPQTLVLSYALVSWSTAEYNIKIFLQRYNQLMITLMRMMRKLMLQELLGVQLEGLWLFSWWLFAVLFAVLSAKRKIKYLTYIRKFGYWLLLHAYI